MKQNIQRYTSSISYNLKLSLFPTLLIDILSYIQIIHILLKTIFINREDSQSDYITFIKDATAFIGGFDFLDSLKTDTIPKYIWLGIVLYFLIHLALFWTLMVYFVNRKSTGKEKYWKNMSILYTIHSRIFMFAILYFFLSLIRFNINCDDSPDEPFYCQDIWSALSIVMICGNFLMALVIEFSMFKINKTRYACAAKSNDFHKLILLHKSIITLIYLIFLDTDSVILSNSILSVLAVCGYLYILFVKFPFYDFTVLKTSIGMTGVITSLTFVLVLRAFSVDIDILATLSIAITLLSIFGALEFFNRLLYKIIEGKFDTPTKAIHFALVLRACAFDSLGITPFAKKFPLRLMLSRGSLRLENIDFLEFNEGKNSQKIEEQVSKHIFDRLHQVLEKHPKSVLLMLYMAKIALKKLNNLPQAVSLARRAESLCHSIPLKNSMNSFNLTLSSFYSKEHLHSNNNLNILNYFNSRRNANQLKEHMKEEIQMHLEFWESTKKKGADVANLISLTQKIDILSTRIDRMYKENSLNFSNYFRASLLLYESYLESSQKRPFRDHKFIDKFTGLTSRPVNITFDSFCDEIAIIITSVEKNKTDIISEVSGSAENLFQMPKDRLIGQNIGCLFPSIFARQHIQMIKDYTESSSYDIHNSYKSYARSKDGDIFEVDIQIQFYPYFEKGIKLMTVIKKTINSSSIMIVGHHGNIVECNESIRKRHNLERSGLNYLKLHNISPDFVLLNKAFNMLYYETNNSRKSLSQQRLDTTGKIGPFYAQEHAMSSLTALDDQIKSRSNLLKDDDDDFPESLGYSPALSPSASFTQDKSKLEVQSSIIRSLQKQITLSSPMLLSGHQLLSPMRSDSKKNSFVEKSKNICEQYIQGGGKLIIFSKDDTRVQIEYNVQIQPHVIEGNVYKLLKLSNGELQMVEPPISQSLRITLVDQTALLDPTPHSQRRRCAVLSFEEGAQEAQELMVQTKDNILIKTVSRVSSATRASGRGPRPSLSRIFDVNSDDRDRSNQIPDNSPMADKQKPDGSIEKKSSVRSSSVTIGRSFKEFRDIISDKASYSASKYVLRGIYLVVVLLIALAGVNYFVSTASVRDIRGDINVINIANERLSESMRSFYTLTDLYLRIKGIAPYSQVDSIQITLNAGNSNMLAINKELTDTVSLLSGDNYRNIFYTNDVLLWEPSGDNLNSLKPLNTFMATNILSSKYYYIANYPGNLTDLDNQPDIIYPLNNTANDYLVASEKAVPKIQSLLESTISSNLLQFKFIVGFSCAMLAVVGIILMVLARRIVKSYHRLFRAMMTIDNEAINERISQLQNMKKLLNQDLENKQNVSHMISSFDNEEDKEKLIAKFTFHIGEAEKSRYSMKRVILSLLRHVFLNTVLLGIITGFFLASFIESSTDFQNLNKMSNQLSVTTKAEYQVSLMIANFYFQIIFQNDPLMKIRNQPSSDQLGLNFQAVSDMNQKLLSTFVQGQSIVDPVIDDLLNSKVCDYLSDASKPSCLVAINNQKVGILAVNSNLVLQTMYYIDLYYKNPTYSGASDIITAFSTSASSNLQTLEAAYNFLNKHIQEVADTKVDGFLNNQMIISWTAVGVILFYTFLAHVVTIKSYESIDMSRGRILKVVTYQMFRPNKALKFYLSKEFNQVNNFLQNIS